MYPIYGERVALDMTYDLEINLCWWNTGQSVRHPIIRRPIPRYPPGYDRGVDYLPLVDGHTPDESTIDTTPALTDSQSESFHSPVTEDVFACVSGSLPHENISHQTQLPPEPQVSCFSTRERLSTNSISAQDTKPHLYPQISHRVLSTKTNSSRGAFRKLKLKLWDIMNLPAFTSQNLRPWSPTSLL